MVLKLFAIRDSKGECFQRVFQALAVGDAVRVFQNLANDKSTPVGQNPEDYGLFELGDWDARTGVITAVEMPKCHAMAYTLVKPVEIPGLTTSSELPKLSEVPSMVN